MALVTTSEYKTWKGISESTYDARIALYIAQAESFADVWTGRKLERQTDLVEKLDGTGSPLLFLRNSPIASIASVKRVNLDGTKTTVASNTYRFNTDDDSRTSLCRISSVDYWCSTRNTTPVWDMGCLNWEVTYTAGYEAGSAPASLEGAIFALVDHLFDKTERDLGAGDLQSEALGSYNYSRAALADVSESVLMMLRSYRRLA